MNFLSLNLEPLREAELQAVSGGGAGPSRPRAFSPFDAITYTEELGRGSTFWDLPGGARDQAHAKAVAQYQALKQANPGAFQVPNDFRGQMIRDRINNGFGQPQLRRQ